MTNEAPDIPISRSHTPEIHAPGPGAPGEFLHLSMPHIYHNGSVVTLVLLRITNTSNTILASAATIRYRQRGGKGITVLPFREWDRVTLENSHPNIFC